jgi:hypothetical protein
MSRPPLLSLALIWIINCNYIVQAGLLLEFSSFISDYSSALLILEQIRNKGCFVLWMGDFDDIGIYYLRLLNWEIS